MKKLAAALLCFCLLMGIFAGCAKDEETKPESSTVDSETGTENGEKATKKPTVPETDNYFAQGVWLAKAEESGLDSYYFFFDSDGKSGSFVSLEDGSRAEFTYEADGDEAEIYVLNAKTPIKTKVEKNSDGSISVDWETIGKQSWTYASEASYESFTFYDNDQLREMAAAYYKSANGQEPPYTGAQTNSDGTVTIQLYDNLGDHNSTWAYYTVDRHTGVGTDGNNNPVTLPPVES